MKVIFNVSEYALNDVIIVDTIAINCSKINDKHNARKKLISQLLKMPISPIHMNCPKQID